MAAKIIADNQWVCTDCAMEIANGEPRHDDCSCFNGGENKHEVDNSAGYWVLDSPREGEDEESVTDEFSHYACDACDCPLAGARHRAVILTDT